MRFDGFARAPNEGPSYPYHLVGIGQIELDGAGAARGTQRSTIIPLLGNTPGFRHSRYALLGTYALKPDGTGDTSFDFFPIDKNGNVAKDPVLRGDFAVSYLGPMDRPEKLWLISSRTQTLRGPTPKDVDEAVSGEGVLVG
jgi:hypothetical protein